MLDLKATYSSGNTSALTVAGGVGAVNTIALGGDGQTVAGVPIRNNAKLAAWGEQSIAADTLYEVQLTSQDAIDPMNGEWYNFGASSVINGFHQYTMIPYATGARKICVRQNTGAGANHAYTIDHYETPVGIKGDYAQPNKISPTITTFAGALTANTWGSQPFAPAQAIPNGKYAILGAEARALTNIALIRFAHPDFQGLTPGFPVMGIVDLTAATAEQLTNREQIYQKALYQFVYLSETLGKPCCPTFSVTNAGTGLQVQMLSNTADTPIVLVNLARVG